MLQLQLFFIESYTSWSAGNSFDINTGAVYSTRACGQGYAGLEKFVSLMNHPKKMTSNNYDKIVTKLIAATKEIAETTRQDACEELRENSTSIVDTSVTCDGSWRRRGYSSLNIVVTAISMTNGNE